MGEKKIETQKTRAYITHQELQEKVVDWSMSTLKRRIEQEGFPAIKDGGGFLIPVDKMHLWFKRREK